MARALRSGRRGRKFKSCLPDSHRYLREQMRVEPRQTIPKFYYYITPLFILLDYFGGLSVRAAVLDSMPIYKNLYYGFCIFCAVIMYLRPQFTAVVTLFESTIIILITVLGIFLPYFQFIMQTDNVLNENWDIINAFSIPRIVNLIMAGIIAVLAFHGSLRTLGISENWPRPNASNN